MSSAKYYEDYLSVSVKDVKNTGFEERYPKRRCGTTYYVNEACDYVLAIEKHGHWVIIDKKTYECIKDKNIHMNNKGRDFRSVGGILIHVKNEECDNVYSHVPRICWNKKNKMLHRVAMNAHKGKQVDHCNHNQLCCVTESLRICNNRQNTLNRRDKCTIYGYEDERHLHDYIYGLRVDNCQNDKIVLLRNDGFEVASKTSEETILEKAFCGSLADCFMEFRDASRLVHRGTDMEDFVYDVSNDFSETFGLLIHHYIFRSIEKEEMRQMNLEYWRDNESALRSGLILF